MSIPLSIACAVHDRQLAQSHVLPSLKALEGDAPTLFLLDNADNAVSHNMAHLCNVLLRLDGPPSRIIVHPDVRFPPDFAIRVAAAIEDLDERGVAWGALGAVGRSWEGGYVWGHEIDEPRVVCAVDACCIVVDTRQDVSFDERTFDGFHCHVEDTACSATRQGSACSWSRSASSTRAPRSRARDRGGARIRSTGSASHASGVDNFQG